MKQTSGYCFKTPDKFQVSIINYISDISVYLIFICAVDSIHIKYISDIPVYFTYIYDVGSI